MTENLKTELKDKCPIWGTPAKRMETGGSDRESYFSPRAGGCYQISSTEKSEIESLEESVKIKLSGWIWEQNFSRDLSESSPTKKYPNINLEVVEKIRNLSKPKIDGRASNIICCVGYLTDYAFGTGIGAVEFSRSGKPIITGCSPYDRQFLCAAGFSKNDEEVARYVKDYGLDYFSVGDRDVILLELDREGHRYVDRRRYNESENQIRKRKNKLVSFLKEKIRKMLLLCRKFGNWFKENVLAGVFAILLASFIIFLISLIIGYFFL